MFRGPPLSFLRPVLHAWNTRGEAEVAVPSFINAAGAKPWLLLLFISKVNFALYHRLGRRRMGNETFQRKRKLYTSPALLWSLLLLVLVVQLLVANFGVNKVKQMKRLSPLFRWRLSLATIALR